MSDREESAVREGEPGPDLAKIRATHRTVEWEHDGKSGLICGNCVLPWPCPTIQLADALEQERERSARLEQIVESVAEQSCRAGLSSLVTCRTSQLFAERGVGPDDWCFPCRARQALAAAPPRARAGGREEP